MEEKDILRTLRRQWGNMLKKDREAYLLTPSEPDETRAVTPIKKERQTLAPRSTNVGAPPSGGKGKEPVVIDLTLDDD